MSASTVGAHLYNIKQKLGVSNQSELTLISIRHGLIEPWPGGGGDCAPRMCV